MTTEDMIRALGNVIEEYKNKPVFTGQTNIPIMCRDVIDKLKELSNPWQTGTPTELEENEYWAWNYVLVLNTTYDCIGNYLAGLLFKPDFERRLFSAPTDGGKHIEIPFSEVVAWQRIEPYEEKENGHTD